MYASKLVMSRSAVRVRSSAFFFACHIWRRSNASRRALHRLESQVGPAVATEPEDFHLDRGDRSAARRCAARWVGWLAPATGLEVDRPWQNPREIRRDGAEFYRYRDTDAPLEVVVENFTELNDKFPQAHEEAQGQYGSCKACTACGMTSRR